MNRLLRIFSLLLLVSMSAVADDGAVVQKTIPPAPLAECPVMEYGELQQFILLVDSWTDESVNKALLFERCTGGASLEDIHKALGVFMENNPTLFFEKMHAARSSEYTISKSVTMLPASLVDDLVGKLNRVRMRYTVVSGIAVPCCLREKEIALSALDASIKKYEDLLVEE